MECINYWRSALIVAGLAMSATANAALQSQIDSLKGVAEISVDAGVGASNDFLVAAVTEASLITRAEVKLRTAGIHVVDYDKMKKDALESPYDKELASRFIALCFLRITLTASINPPGFMYYSLSIQLYQPATLRKGIVTASAVTWEESKIGSMGSSRIDLLNAAIDNSIDRFVNDYLKANPKP